MPKTPLRALRVPDELWRAAQARARESGETVSGVVRRALVDYVDVGLPAPAPAVAEERAPTALPAMPDSRFLLAQGMVMQRHGLDPAAAAAYLRKRAVTDGRSVDETVASFLADRAPAALGATPLG